MAVAEWGGSREVVSRETDADHRPGGQTGLPSAGAVFSLHEELKVKHEEPQSLPTQCERIRTGSKVPTAAWRAPRHTTHHASA